jgi:hypothetical protein
MKWRPRPGNRWTPTPKNNKLAGSTPRASVSRIRPVPKSVFQLISDRGLQFPRMESDVSPGMPASATKAAEQASPPMSLSVTVLSSGDSGRVATAAAIETSITTRKFDRWGWSMRGSIVASKWGARALTTANHAVWASTDSLLQCQAAVHDQGRKAKGLSRGGCSGLTHPGSDGQGLESSGSLVPGGSFSSYHISEIYIYLRVVWLDNY